MSRMVEAQDEAAATPANIGGASRMAGTDAGTPPGGNVESTSGADAQQRIASAVEIIRSAEESVMGIAQAFPQASKEIRDARTALRSVMKAIVSNPGGPEPVAPRTNY